MTPRRAALAALTDIADGGAYAHLRLKNLPGLDDSREIKWTLALVYTVLDHLLTIDYYLAHYVQRPCKPAIRNVLRLGIGELLYFGTPSHAAVDGAVELVKEIGKAPLKGFVNGVLRTVDREREQLPALPEDPAERLSIRFSYPLFLVREWLARYGEGFTEALIASPAARLNLRAQYPFTGEALAVALPVPVKRGALDENCLLAESGFDVTDHPLFLDGSMTVQSEGAMLVCRAMGDCKGKDILDVCAAPGGKSAYLASLTGNDVSLTCLELHENRTTLMERTFQRLHVNARALCRDACVLDETFCGRFDGVLIDAPCSGLGLLNDKPDIRYKKTDEDVEALAHVQRRLLAINARYVRPGGVLVYATCTISGRENETQVERFLNEHPEFFLEPMPVPLKNNGMLQLFPNVHGTDGFFMARMRLKEE